jgi:hypothetical protein
MCELSGFTFDESGLSATRVCTKSAFESAAIDFCTSRKSVLAARTSILRNFHLYMVHAFLYGLWSGWRGTKPAIEAIKVSPQKPDHHPRKGASTPHAHALSPRPLAHHLLGFHAPHAPGSGSVYTHRLLSPHQGSSRSDRETVARRHLCGEADRLLRRESEGQDLLHEHQVDREMENLRGYKSQVRWLVRACACVCVRVRACACADPQASHLRLMCVCALAQLAY